MAKLVSQFNDFLRGTVNLNQTRIAALETNVAALQNFLRQCDWEPRVRGFEEQGSWAHDTIIKPVDGGEFDADLLVLVDPVGTWSAADYVRTLGKAFAASATYSDKVKTWDYCVTITYAGERKVDIAPLVRNRRWEGSLEVCNRTADRFDRSEPADYTAWLRERNVFSGSNSFRKVTRLLKYLRDIKTTFTCPSVLLTTLLGERINWLDKDTGAFADVPTALKTLIGRLDAWLQARPAKPMVPNPVLASEDFAAGWTEAQYLNFRAFIHKYRGWIDEAYDEEDRSASIRAWRRIFGDDFAKGEELRAAASATDSGISMLASLLASTARHADALVEAVRERGVAILPTWFYTPPHMQAPNWNRAATLSNDVQIFATWHARRDGPVVQRVGRNDVLPRTGGIWFDVGMGGGAVLPADYRVQWRITNTGMMALRIGQGRGAFYAPERGNRRWEEMHYRGVHIVEAFILRRADDLLIAKSPPFHVVIE